MKKSYGHAMKKKTEKIDFVITWVDGNDPQWLAERANYMPQTINDGCVAARYRDLGLLRYWFRGVEKFAPWVNQIFFVTWGHCPEWINKEHPKLKIVKHSDYIPAEFLPTYNSNVIELSLHKIAQLSEQFVLFNDDTFLTNHVKPTDFFQNGLPCETVFLGQAQSSDYSFVFPHTLLNNSAIINKYFNKRKVLCKYWKTFFSLRYGKILFQNLVYALPRFFSAFADMHVPASHLKSTFFEVWEKENEVLTACGKERFRSSSDVSHWLMKNWRYCQGKVYPRSIKWGKYLVLGRDAQIVSAIKKRKYKAICLNDNNLNQDFSYYQKELVLAFEEILPEKSSFEI